MIGLSHAESGLSGSSWSNAIETKTLLQQVAQTRAGTVKARFRVSNGPVQHFCNFRVLVALDVMKYDDEPLEWVQLF